MTDDAPTRPARRRSARPSARWTPVALIVGVLLLVGCSATSATRPVDDGRPVVLTTFTVLADMARQVAGDHLVVESITKVGAEIHGYEPTPRDLTAASRADLVLDNGLGLEAWFARFLQGRDVPHAVLSEGVTPLPIDGDAYAGRPNPHAWMSPNNGVIYVSNLVAAFSELDPANAADYRANGAAYTEQLRGQADRLREAVLTLPPSQRSLVTCEGAFSYLAADAGLDEHYIWPVNAERQATPQRVAGVIDAVRADDIPAVFCESTVSPAPMLQVVDSTDARFGGTLYVDSLSEPDGPVPSYLALLSHDIDVIIDGLTGDPR